MNEKKLRDAYKINITPDEWEHLERAKREGGVSNLVDATPERDGDGNVKSIITIDTEDGAIIREIDCDNGKVVKIEGITNKHRAWKKVAKACGLGDVVFGEYDFETRDDGSVKAWIFHVPLKTNEA